MPPREEGFSTMFSSVQVTEMRSAGATILSVNDEHALATLEHPSDHFDPFDSLLLAVARVERLVLLTADAALLALAQKEPRLPIKRA